MIRIVTAIAVVLLAGVASAEPHAKRVVLADPDPELRSAVESSLAPWQFEIVVDPSAPESTADADYRAGTLNARFVVWRRDGDLVVYDRDRGAAEHREGKAGPLDATDAAAAALTVKTLMRLPTPGTNIELAPPSTTRGAVLPVGGPELRVQLGVASRITRGSETGIGARAALVVLARPWGGRPWRFGIEAEAGTSASVEKSGFKGSWRDYGLLGVASWSRRVRPWEIEPRIAAGVVRSVFSGTESSMTREDGRFLALFRGGVWLRRRVDLWSMGGSFSIDAAPGGPTYAKLNGNGAVFEVPTFSFAIGVFAAVDLGR